MSGRSALPLLQGSLAENIMLFARLLRATGMPVGTGSVLNAIRAVSLIGIESQQDLHTVLLCQFVSRREQMPVFDQTFALFWRNPKLMEKLMGAMLPTLQSDQDQQPLIRRLGEALSSGNTQSSGQDEEQVELQANLSASESEILQSRDFEQMSESELQVAKKMLKHLKLPVKPIQTRRHQASVSRAHIDMRRTMQNSLRNSELIPLQFKRQITRPPAIIVLCDISGSMAQYSRMFLHFMHAMTNNGDRVHSFLFGTRLTNISRYLRNKDVDLALEETAKAVEDWSGGTRIGFCLKQFNQHWSRRMLGQGAVVILLTDGLDRGEGPELGKQMERLSKSCRQLVWLNPLLRYKKFEPRAEGVRIMLPYVDVFRSAHNINSLAELPALLNPSKAQAA
ncbi:MAG: VWA domain-containing protein [Pseudomonadota bacterium]|nr:VWA domain-containing protein [Gammaproteobacteria bacterium]MEC7126538.1 VWA domain-containing protein [Pseudomonadota bacterium]MEC7894498.1 VWA domain-containing protein [Pseudomonadota bacterium]MEC8408508.1 VWA domain-containing protein [Pseudomonadota bacterium]MEC9085715.1 VWA domain-containing protein [Pseudomonadota bacterium]